LERQLEAIARKESENKKQGKEDDSKTEDTGKDEQLEDDKDRPIVFEGVQRVENKEKDLGVLPDNEKVYRELATIKARILKDETSLGELKDKNVCILFGTTGSGKSTLANALIKGPEKIK